MRIDLKNSSIFISLNAIELCSDHFIRSQRTPSWNAHSGLNKTKSVVIQLCVSISLDMNSFALIIEQVSVHSDALDGIHKQNSTNK